MLARDQQLSVRLSSPLQHSILLLTQFPQLPSDITETRSPNTAMYPQIILAKYVKATSTLRSGVQIKYRAYASVQGEWDVRFVFSAILEYWNVLWTSTQR